MQVAIGGKATGPLAGIRVIDLSTIVSGPLCGQILGDLGADVVKIETPIGDSTRYLGTRKGDFAGSFAQVNRNKRSVVLDLKRDAAAEALRRLVADADVLVENFRPGVMDRLGVGYERLGKINPRLVYASISGFGPDGPYASLPAYDMVIQALSSVAKMIGSDDEPKLVSNLLADKTAGLNAAFAIAAALYERERTGVGQRIDIPMLDAFASFLLSDTLGANAFGPPPASGAFGELLFRAWKTTDGHVAIVIIEDHQWASFCRVIEREDTAGDERFSSMSGRMLNAAELIAFMEQEIARYSTAELVGRAHELGTPVAPVHGLEEFLEDPQVKSSGLVFELDHPLAGPIRVLRSAPRFSRTPSNVRRPAPNLGAHTAEVLREAGLTDAEITEIAGEG